MKQCKCGSYAFNLYKEDIDQGDLCDVHYWKEKALAQPERVWVEGYGENASGYVNSQLKQEPVAWRVTYSKVIKALAAIVTVHTPDNLFDLDAIPRDPVMHLVQQIKAAIDGYKPPQRKPLTDEQIQKCWYRTQGDSELFARAIEAAHGIKE